MTESDLLNIYRIFDAEIYIKLPKTKLPQALYCDSSPKFWFFRRLFYK